MATLPDLQTTLMSTLCYFDAGVVIKKSDILPLLESFTEYDNGVDGIMSFTYDGTRVTTGTRIKVQVRVRTDGLTYAWGLRADEVKDGAQKDSTGGTVNFQRSLLPISAFGNVAPATGDTLLFRAIQAMVAAVTTAGKTTPTTSTVSYYDFEFTSTGNIYVFGRGNTVGGGSTDTQTWQVTQPVGLTIFLLGYRMSYFGSNSGISNGNWTFAANGNTLFSKSNPTGGGSGAGVLWSGRQGASITAVLLAPGTQNNVTLTAAMGNSGTMNAFAVLVVYASA